MGLLKILFLAFYYNRSYSYVETSAQWPQQQPSNARLKSNGGGSLLRLTDFERNGRLGMNARRAIMMQRPALTAAKPIILHLLASGCRLMLVLTVHKNKTRIVGPSDRSFTLREIFFLHEARMHPGHRSLRSNAVCYCRIILYTVQ